MTAARFDFTWIAIIGTNCEPFFYQAWIFGAGYRSRRDKSELMVNHRQREIYHPAHGCSS
jgi:hypothetical protein